MSLNQISCRILMCTIIIFILHQYNMLYIYFNHIDYILLQSILYNFIWVCFTCWSCLVGFLMFCVCLVCFHVFSYVFEWVDFEGFVLYLVISWTLPVKIFIFLALTFFSEVIFFATYFLFSLTSFGKKNLKPYT